MGAKFELVVYLFKDVEKTRSTEWRDNMVLRGGPVTWKIIKRSFLDRFFRKELREAKLEEFFNFRQGGMSVLD